MTYTPAYLSASQTPTEERVDPFGGWRPRQPDEVDEEPSPHRSPHASALLSLGAELDRVKAECWHEAQQPHPTRRMVGPAMAARHGIPATTPAT